MSHQFKVGDWVWDTASEYYGHILGYVYKIDKDDFKVELYDKGCNCSNEWFSNDKGNWIKIEEFVDDFYITKLTPKVVNYLWYKYRPYALAKLILEQYVEI